MTHSDHLEAALGQATHQAIDAFASFGTGLLAISMMSCMLLFLLGQLRMKHLVSTVAGGVGLLVLLQLARLFDPVEGAGIDWTRTGLLALAIVLVIATTAGGLVAQERIHAGRSRHRDAAKALAAASDPIAVARSMVPDMAADVERAMRQIELLRSVELQPDRQEDADVLAMIDGRLPSVMRRYAEATRISTDEERRALARLALASVVEIGAMAEDARRRVAAAMRDGLDTESRYIASKRASPSLGID